jgi:hypothetical protein
MLEKKTILEQLEVKPNGVIFVKELNQIIDDGKIISSIPHRYSVTPCDNISESPYESLKIIAKALWTKKIKADYLDQLSNKGLVK